LSTKKEYLMKLVSKCVIGSLKATMVLYSPMGKQDLARLTLSLVQSQRKITGSSIDAFNRYFRLSSGRA
jgi:hypothetical protein